MKARWEALWTEAWSSERSVHVAILSELHIASSQLCTLRDAREWEVP